MVSGSSPIRQRQCSTISPAQAVTVCCSIAFLVHCNSEVAMDSSICESQLPFHWYHRTFTASGTQYDTLTNHVGADSLLTLTLHVIPSVNEDMYDSICDNRSRIFEQTTYTAAGDYPHYFLSSQGCDSTRTLHLTLLHTTQGDTTASVCNQLVWNGHTYTASEEVTVSDYSTYAAGCDSAVTLHLTVHHSSHTDYYGTCVENNLPRYFNGIAVMGDTVGVEVTLTDIHGCDSVVDYQLQVWYNVSTVSDSTICDNGLESFIWNGVASTLTPIADGVGEKSLLLI